MIEMTWATREARRQGVLLRQLPRWSAAGEGEVEELGWFAQAQRLQNGLLAGGERGSLGDLAVGGGEGDQVRAVEFVPDVAPGAACGVVDDPDQQQGEPAQLDVGADPVLPVVEHRPEREGALHVLPPALDGDEFGSPNGDSINRRGSLG